MTQSFVAPYINFQGRAREALEHYRGLFGGTVDLQTSNGQGSKPAGASDRVLLGKLEADGLMILGTDGHPTYPPKVGDNMAVAFGGSDAARVAKIFNGLGEGGQVKGPLQEKPGATGYVVDKFGINWIVRIDK
jgi:PhnB protein